MVCTKSGYVYERRLIAKHLETSGTEPVTGEACSLDDLLPLRGPTRVAPRPAAATSVAGILGALQSEWDAMMLESHALRTSLDTTRQELSQALYQHDGACRVIARLIRERDAARAALANAQTALARGGGASAAAVAEQSGAAAASSAAADVDMGGAATGAVTQELLQSITDKYKELSKAVSARNAQSSRVVEGLNLHILKTHAPAHHHGPRPPPTAQEASHSPRNGDEGINGDTVPRVNISAVWRQKPGHHSYGRMPHTRSWPPYGRVRKEQRDTYL